MRGSGGLIRSVEKGSVAEAAGLRAGDRLFSIDGHVLRDVIDVQFYGADGRLHMEAERDGETLRLREHRRWGQALGLEFFEPTFDGGVRRCTNRCEFCFVKMNAPGMRRSLYIKDDDYRYSFLNGSFVTLTNLTEADWERLDEQRLSPLYVSVQATEPGLRARLLGRRSAPDLLEQLERLARLRIEVHAQVVLIPGVNDGEALARTIRDLRELYEKPVLTVSVVPVGLTRYHRGTCRTYTADESRAVLDQVEPWRAECREALSCSFVYPSDEWYLVAGRDVPLAEAYDGFPQVENGVGMVRQLLDEWTALKAQLEREAERPQRATPTTLVCGTLVAPVLGRIVGEWNALGGADLRLVPVVNEFFGAVTTVSGLLTGQDVVAALRGRDLGEWVLLPQAMFTGRYGAGDAPAGVTLDGMSLQEIGARLGVPVAMAGTLGEVVEQLGARGAVR